MDIENFLKILHYYSTVSYICVLLLLWFMVVSLPIDYTSFKITSPITTKLILILIGQSAILQVPVLQLLLFLIAIWFCFILNLVAGFTVLCYKCIIYFVMLGPFIAYIVWLLLIVQGCTMIPYSWLHPHHSI